MILQIVVAGLTASLLSPVSDWPLTVAFVSTLWIVVMVNVFNFMDGINGISGWNVLVAGCVYFLLGLWLGEVSIAAAGAAVGAAGIAFLPWNAMRPRVFLGDVGSYSLGGALAILGVASLQAGAPVEAVLGPLAMYLGDTGWTLARRISTGEEWLNAHRTHVYQRLCDAGMSHARVAVLTAAIAVALSTLGSVSLIGYWPLRVTADVLAAFLLTSYLAAPALLRHRQRRLSS